MKTDLDREETRALRYSAGGALLVGCVAIVFSRVSASQAVLLDGLFNLTYFATGLFTLKVARLLVKGDTREFPVGYDHFEPLTNGLKGILVLGVTVTAMAGAVIALVSGGRTIEAGPAIAYGGFATAACAVVALVLHLAAKRTPSPLVKADGINWILNAAISSAVLLVFLSIKAIEGTRLEFLVPYVDPALVLLVAGACVMVPVRMGWDALMQLLNRAPAGITKEVRSAVERALAGFAVEELFVGVLEPGRFRKMMVHVVVPADFDPGGLARLDELRAKVLRALAAQHPEVVLDMLFTADRIWAAPLAETDWGAVALGAGAQDP